MSLGSAANNDYARLFHHAPAGYLVVGTDGTILCANATICDWAGVGSGALEGRPLFDLMPAGDRFMFRTHAGPKLDRDGHLAEISIELLGSDGQRKPVLLSANRIIDGPQVRDLMIFFAAPERRRYERELANAHRQLEDAEAGRTQLLEEAHHRALHDPLTGLPNRLKLEESLLSALARAGEERTRVGLLFCDVNNFKQVNDTLGHAAGDLVLKHIARRLAEAVRGADTVSRVSGDEFVVLLPLLRDPKELEAVATRVQESVAGTITVVGTEIQVGISVGRAETVVSAAAGTFEHQELAKTLLITADQDMYRVKTEMRMVPPLEQPLGPTPTPPGSRNNRY
ncbi:sensor domain-containing diguanylate cyclase [Paeniglutamicibacter sp. Y32M11]|uniref:sensor domain-containing protein n=1 Tax=Paeniglutamicibacter sp. Y32M11 TaxID=2853258 RepID=UPI001C53341C|nr:sensor domain-containing diguanylate cyclase [Paeniglutamicibacter sp. Y32M11]QXQ08760.1 sensor domain-containing diguanylate cyclase [Paeniglutamicibacter sp. Y32M11]